MRNTYYFKTHHNGGMSSRWRRTLAMMLISASSGLSASPLIITATSSVDTVNSFAALGGASQDATIETQSATLNSANVTETAGVFSSPNSVSDATFDVGSVARATLTMSGTAGNVPAQTQGLFADVVLSITNPTAVSYEVTIGIAESFLHGLSGNDAFINYELRVTDPTLNLLSYALHQRDTVNGNADTALTAATLMFVIAPSATFTMDAFLRLWGGAFDVGDAYRATAFASLEIQNIQEVGGGGGDVPLPPVAVLVLSGLFLVARRSRQLKGNLQ